MPSSDNTCPHCGLRHNPLLTDRQGSVGWCRDCHRAWIPALRRALAQECPQQPRPTERERRMA